jgi:hypothetical protein
LSQNGSEGKDSITIEDDCEILLTSIYPKLSKNDRTNTEVLSQKVLAPPFSGIHIAEIETRPTEPGFSRIVDYSSTLF